MLRLALFVVGGAATGAIYAALLQRMMQLEDGNVLLAAVCVFAGALLAYLMAIQGAGTDAQRAIQIVVYPLVVVPAMIGVIVWLAIVAIYLPFVAIPSMWRQRLLRTRLRAQGRYAALDDLRLRLEAGEGCLIEECGYQGAFRIWWTADDQLAHRRPELSDEACLLKLLVEGHDPNGSNAQTIAEFLDVENGTAVLTAIRPRSVSSGRFSHEFPRMRRVKVVRLTETL